MRDALATLNGVRDVHDLHVWTLTSGVYALSAHCVVVDARFDESLLSAARAVLKQRFTIEHATIQVESTPCGDGQRHA